MPYNLDKLIQAIATNQTEHAVFSDEDMSDQQISQLAEAVKKTKSLKKLYFGDEVHLLAYCGSAETNVDRLGSERFGKPQAKM